MNAYINVEQIKAEYAPYHTMSAFRSGYENYMNGLFGDSPYHKGVAAQAYDRGQEAAMKVKRADRWVEQNVGLN